MYFLPRRFSLYKTSSVVVIFVLPALGHASQETGSSCQQLYLFSGRKKLTSAINQIQLFPNTKRSKAGPVWNEEDAAGFLPDDGPVVSPSRAFKGRHK